MSKESSVSSDSKVIVHMQVSSEEWLNHSFIYLFIHTSYSF